MQKPTQTDRRDAGSVTHPAHEDWMAFLYGEVPRPRRANLRQHLAQCDSCRAQVNQWRGAMESLDACSVAEVRRQPKTMPAAIKWGMAALFALGLGYGFGRFSAATAGLPTATDSPASAKSLQEAVRRDLEQDFQQQLRLAFAAFEQRLYQELAGRIEQKAAALAAETLAAAKDQTDKVLALQNANHQQEHEALLDALARVAARQNRHAADLASFRTETERMAVLTEESFRRAQQEMVRLARFNDRDSFGARPAAETEKR